MTTKNKFLIFTTLALTGVTKAAALTFRPSVQIPGMASSTQITPDSIANYINIFYTYGSRFAALLAMFMLIIAGWQWTMAGGSPERVNRSKDIIVGVFVGLALLLGGNVLMSQISKRLVNFNSLNIKPVDGLNLTLVNGDSCCAFVDKYNDEGDVVNFKAFLEPAYTSSTVSCKQALPFPAGFDPVDDHWEEYDGIEVCQKAMTICDPPLRGCQLDTDCPGDVGCTNIAPPGLTNFYCCLK